MRFTARPPRGPGGRGACGDMVVEHYDDMLCFYGRDLGLRIARKHLGWYTGRGGAPPVCGRPDDGDDSPPSVLALIGGAFAARRGRCGDAA